jgi:hypothetical protein
MSLKDQITEDMKTAMRAKDSARLGTIRLLLAACKQREVDERIVLDDVAVVAIVDKLIKQRKDSVEAFVKAERMDLADNESAEIKVLQALPAAATGRGRGAGRGQGNRCRTGGKRPGRHGQGHGRRQNAPGWQGGDVCGFCCCEGCAGAVTFAHA